MAADVLVVGLFDRLDVFVWFSLEQVRDGIEEVGPSESTHDATCRTNSNES